MASVCTGEATVQQLRSYLRKAKLRVSKAGTPKQLREIAKQEAKGLLRIAQTGLKNTAGGLGECLHLALCNAVATNEENMFGVLVILRRSGCLEILKINVAVIVTPYSDDLW